MLEIPEVLAKPAPLWIMDHGKELTASVLLKQRLDTPHRIVVFMVLLKHLRGWAKNHPSVAVGRVPGSRSAALFPMEDRLRAEVHDNPDRFDVRPEALREYHTVHLAEMIAIIIRRLQEVGIDTTNPHSQPSEAALAQLKHGATKGRDRIN